MFIVRVTVNCKPDLFDIVLSKLTPKVTEVPAQFAGCQRFAVSVDVLNSNTVHTMEEWGNEQSFSAYQCSDYFKQAMTAIGPCPDSAYCTAVRVGP